MTNTDLERANEYYIDKRELKRRLAAVEALPEDWEEDADKRPYSSQYDEVHEAVYRCATELREKLAGGDGPG